MPVPCPQNLDDSACAVGLVSPSASAKHQSEVLQLTAWGRSRALIQALIAEAHRAFQVLKRQD